MPERCWELGEENGDGNRVKFMEDLLNQMSSVENPGWLFDIGDYTTQLYGDYNKPI